MTPWEIEGRELVNCNCSYGCPCQFIVDAEAVVRHRAIA
jgi:Uncharacterized conserved protein